MGHTRPTQCRRPRRFATSVQQVFAEERLQRQQQLLEGIPFGPKDIVFCRRVAISRALVARGF